jgi:hypothetical protein
MAATFRVHPDYPIGHPWTFHFGGSKDNVYIPPMSVDLQELHDRIFNTIALVDVTFLDKLWDKLEYRLDVCRITRGSHIEHLQKTSSVKKCSVRNFVVILLLVWSQ